jgi:hypothetical protein
VGHRHVLRGPLRHHDHPARHRPAGNGRPASRARRRPPHPLTAWRGNHPERRASPHCVWSGVASAARRLTRRAES